MARWITGIILAITVTLMLLFAPVMALRSLVLGISLIGAWEFFTIALPKCFFEKVLGLISVLAGMLLVIFSREVVCYLSYIYLVIGMAFVMQFRGAADQTEKIRRVAFFVLGVFYVVFLFGMLALILDLPHFHFWIFLTLACTHFGDTMAYVVGRKFGRNKLAPSISPGKTVEGFCGALVGGVLAAIVMRQIFWPEFDLLHVAGIGLLLAVVGVMGDLAESLFKRGFGVKDSGALIPGHGGILDRVDALLFTAPLVYLMATYFK